MCEECQYKYLGPWRGSNYRQYFYKERKIRAEVLYRETVGLEPRTPEEVAQDYDVPVEAVLEAIHYCTHHAGQSHFNCLGNQGVAPGTSRPSPPPCA